MILRKLNNKLSLLAFKIEWKRDNRHNFTHPICVFPNEKVQVGKGTYGGLNVETYGVAMSKLEIGNYCSIARDVLFLLDGEHEYNKLSTYPYKVRYKNEQSEAYTKGPIIVKDDVWIGERSIILSGVTIGQGAIIAAGSIVSKNIPPYAIYAGGRIIKYRFNETIIQKLLKINFSKLDSNMIMNNVDDLYSDIDCFLQSNLYTYLTTYNAKGVSL